MSLSSFLFLFFLTLPYIIQAQVASSATDEQLQAPVFSDQPGFYTQPLDLQLSHPEQDNGATIHYTLDGSKPTADSPIYENGITITDRTQDPDVLSLIPTNEIDRGSRSWREPGEKVRKATTIRAVAVKNESQSTVSSGTYFVFDDGRDSYSTLPVVSIITDSLHLFGDAEGIYVSGDKYTGNDDTGNYYQRGADWEHPAHIELFEKDGSVDLNQDIGIRIHGGFSRRFPQKSLRLYARSDYGINRFYNQIFHEQDDDNYNRLILRNSGNDFGHTMFMDAAAQSLIRHFNVDTQAYRPSVLFLNGEFWGIHNFRERYDRHYLERVYGADPDNVELLEGNGIVKEGSNNHYDDMITYIEDNDLSKQEKMDHVYTLMDIDNYLDYYSAQIYYGNNDWPHNNIDFWRVDRDYTPDAPKGLDGRWRWLLYDVDRSLGYSTDAGFDMIDWVTAERDRRYNAKWPNHLFLNLLDNEQFFHDLINRISDHLNTAFQPERVTSVVDSLKKPLEPVIEEHIHRWTNHGSYNHWNRLVNNMYSYAEDRPGYLRNHLMEHFDLGEKMQLEVDVSSKTQGFVRVNQTDINSSTPGVHDGPYPWQGTYFSEIPVNLHAVSQQGYRFSHWEIQHEHVETQDLNKPSITVRLNESKSYTAHFIEDEVSPIEKEPIHYWLFTNNLPNNTALSMIDPVHSNVPGALLEYVAAIPAYPPDEDDPEETDGILDRVNNPTEINYNASLCDQILVGETEMRGIRIRNPSLYGDSESKLVLHLPTSGYEDTELNFAARRTSNGQRQLVFEYSTDGSPDSWTQEGLDNHSATMYLAYKKISVSFSGIPEADNNPDLRFRIRFAGDEEIRSGNNGNVRFNNISFSGFSGEFEEPADPEPQNPIHYWVFTDDLPNNYPLEQIEPVSSEPGNASIIYQPAISGYPAVTGTEGIMDRVNNPTDINYYPGFYNDLDAEQAGIRGIRTRNPSMVDDRESALIIKAPSQGFKDLSFSFAARRTSNGQRKLVFDYSTNGEEGPWLTDGLDNTEGPTFESYRLYTLDFGDVTGVNDNNDFAIRIRFAGDQHIRQGNDGNVRFNNMLLHGNVMDEPGPVEGQPPIISNMFTPTTILSDSLFSFDLDVKPGDAGYSIDRISSVNDTEGLKIENSKLTFIKPIHEHGDYQLDLYAVDERGLSSDTVSSAITVTMRWPYGDANLSGTVSPLDASLVLKHAIGLTDLVQTAVEKNDDRSKYAEDAMYVSDVTGQGIGPYDASLILQKNIGLIEHFPVESQDTEEPLLAKSHNSSRKEHPSISWDIEDEIDATNPSNTNITLKNVASNTYSLQLEINYDHENLTFDRFNADLPEGWLTVENNESQGQFKLAMAGPEPLGYGYQIGQISFTPVNKTNTGFKLEGEAYANDQPPRKLEPLQFKKKPDEFALNQNYPNPFNPVTQITFSLAKETHVKLEVYNAIGQRVATLINEHKNSGYHQVGFHAENLSSGVYLYRLTTESFSKDRKMMLVK